MKTHVLILSKTFPKWHPRAGAPTYFKKKIRNAGVLYFKKLNFDFGTLLVQPDELDDEIPANSQEPKVKVHTIRGNYERWKKIIDEVRSGEAILSVRQWTGKPYNSKQEEIQRFTNRDYISVQKLEFLEYQDGFTGNGIWIAGHTFPHEHELELAQNDGLSLEDWRAWFAKEDKSQAFAIIQFTSFRY